MNSHRPISASHSKRGSIDNSQRSSFFLFLIHFLGDRPYGAAECDAAIPSIWVLFCGCFKHDESLESGTVQPIASDALAVSRDL